MKTTASGPLGVRESVHPHWRGRATGWIGDDGSLSSRPPRIVPTDDGRRDAVATAAAKPGAARRIAVRALGRIVIVPVETIVRLEAQDNYVRIWAERTLLHKETLTALCARLDPAAFLRIHRSHAIRISALRELRLLTHGEFDITLTDGTSLRSGRSFRKPIEAWLGLR
jgi:two-component system LytT family response regulator